MNKISIDEIKLKNFIKKHDRFILNHELPFKIKWDGDYIPFHIFDWIDKNSIGRYSLEIHNEFKLMAQDENLIQIEILVNYITFENSDDAIKFKLSFENFNNM